MAAAIGAWSVKGVDEEAKILAKRAASEAGVTMGLWLEAAIMHIAGQNSSSKPVLAAASSETNTASAHNPVVNLPVTEKSARFFNTTIRFGATPTAPVDATTAQTLAATLQPWQENIETIQQQLQDQMVWLEQKLADLADSLQQMRNAVPPAPESSEPVSFQSEVDKITPAFSVQEISATYQLQSGYEPQDRWSNIFDNILRLALIAALCAAAFLIGQRMGFDLSAF